MKLQFRIVFFALILVFCSHFVWAQAYSGEACTGSGNALLKQQLHSGVIPTQSGIIYKFYEQWSSSALPAKSTKPQSIDSQDLEAQEQAAMAYGVDTCRFSTLSLSDGKPETAWCEGVDGLGVGEVAIAFIPNKKPKSLVVRTGYTKSNETFMNNGRPLTLEITVFEPVQIPGFSSSESNVIPSLVRRGNFIIKLEDKIDPQVIAIPAEFLAGWPDETGYALVPIAIEIKDVKAGIKYQDSCVSEISLL